MRPRGIVLAAGLGTRLLPFSASRPKASFPVGHETLLARALRTIAPFVDEIAVNVSHESEWFTGKVPSGVTIFAESPEPLGTAGALVNMREWRAGRPAAVLNVDSALFGEVTGFFQSWNNTRTRLLVIRDHERPDFGSAWRFAGLSLMTDRSLSKLGTIPSDLYHSLWKTELDNHELELYQFAGTAIDCGTPSGLLEANLLASNGRSVVEGRTDVRGAIDGCLVLEGAIVNPDQHYRNSIVGAHHVVGPLRRASRSRIRNRHLD
jgi:NDP-sugar pyrophosphorylase family protein